jgi:hypothetical protein
VLEVFALCCIVSDTVFRLAARGKGGAQKKAGKHPVPSTFLFSDANKESRSEEEKEAISPKAAPSCTYIHHRLYYQCHSNKVLLVLLYLRCLSSNTFETMVLSVGLEP